jgi:prepilin-type N-terminal cleavage/methylation domain-containing protein
MAVVGTNRTISAPSRNSGFSLVEALVVVMVILVIAAIAIPSFVQAKMKANEASAISSMHTIRVAQILYAQTYPDIGFASSLADLGTRGTNCESPGPKNACIIMDDALASGTKSGYVFDLVSDGRNPSLNYSLNGNPESAGISGRCSFATDQSGEIAVVSNGTGASRYSLGNGTSCGN